MNNLFQDRIKTGILFGILGFLLYLPSVRYQYALDDYLIILENKFVQNGTAGLKDVFTHNYADGGNRFNDGLYRPLSTATFAIENEWIGKDVAWFSHFGNALTYGLIAFLLFYFLTAIGIPTLVAIVSTLVFVFHPVHSEVVANIKGRDDLFSLLFGLVFGIFLLKAITTKKLYLVPAFAAFVLALFSKETSMIYFIAFPMMLLALPEVKLKTLIFYTLPFLITTILFYQLRTNVIDSMAAAVDPSLHALLNNPIAASDDSSLQLATAFKLQLLYVVKLLLPYPLIHDYSYNLIPMTGWASIQTIIGLLLFFGGSAVSFYYGIIKRKYWALAIGFYLGTIFITSNILVHIGAMFAERFLFAPSLGFAIVVGFALVELTKISQQRIAIAITGICVVFGYMSLTRSEDWKDNLTLFSADLEKGLTSARINYNYATAMMKEAEKNGETSAGPNWQLCEKHFKMALAIYPTYFDGLNNLGNAYRRVKNYEQAEFYLKKVIEINKLYSKAVYNLGVVYFESQQYELCKQTLTKYLEWGIYTADTWYMLGKSSGFLGDFASAENYIKKALEIKPNVAEFQYLLASSYAFQEKNDLAEKEFTHILEKFPDHYESSKNFAILCLRTNQPAKALDVLNKAVKYFPDDPSIQEMIAQIKSNM